MLQEKKNNENILIRAVIAGLLDVLNNKIIYNQYRCNEDESIDVPWFFDQSGSERFMQDFFTNYAYCLNSKCPKNIDGNMDRIPRGVISYKGLSIDPARMTSRFTEGHYTKEKHGKLETYSSFLYSIPINVKFDAELHVDSLTLALRLEQLIIEKFYKTVTNYVMYNGMRLGMQIGFSDSIGNDKITQYTFDTNKRIHKLTFSVEIESYLPTFDETTEMLYNTRIKNIGLRLYEKDEKNDGIIWFESPINYDNILFSKYNKLMLEWNYKDEGAIIQKVDISWINNNNEEFFIERGLYNNMSYLWSIPESVNNNKPIILHYFDNDIIKVLKKPDIVIIPQNDIIKEDSFIILNNNKGYYSSDYGEIDIDLEYVNKQDKIREIHGLKILIENGEPKKILFNDNNQANIFMHEPSEISIRIYNAVNHKVFAEIKNVKIM